MLQNLQVLRERLNRVKYSLESVIDSLSEAVDDPSLVDEDYCETVIEGLETQRGELQELL